MNLETLCDKIELQSCVKEKVLSFTENFDFQKIDEFKRYRNDSGMGFCVVIYLK